ncbi:TonB-dependent receptor [Chelatococcus reniformis]|uniref:TonB-dependent receptor n=2 Tax=Chelatococcus reniformis TaxID=1494448 RepID=A0A916XCV6_9HYPH|nr:TonB-dependent receptor [Chelatococcus reniformis]
MMLAPAAAQDASNHVELSTITVEGAGRPRGPLQDDVAKLEIKNDTGSFVKLTPLETPGVVDVVSQQDIKEKGLRTLTEAYNSVPGVFAGNLPGEPGVTSIRGFSRAATGYSIDGVQMSDPLLASRNYDTFSFERVEVLKGPASVIYGTGALAGAINLVTKQPQLGETHAEALASYGSFNTLRTGADFNASLGPNAAARTTLSYGQSGGYIDDTNPRTFGFGTAVTFTPTDRLTLNASLNYFHDNYSTPYQGIPLVPLSAALAPSKLVTTQNGYVVDEAMRAENYNVYNGLMKSDAAWLRGSAEYRLTDSWTIKNELNAYKAFRDWESSEDYTFNPATGLLDRSTTKINHDHRFWSDRLSANFDGDVLGLRHRFGTGVEYIDTTLISERRFGTTTPVTRFDPARGLFPVDTARNFPTRQNFDSRIKTLATFGEDALNLTPDWLAVAGIRYESIRLERGIDDLNTGLLSRFDRTFDSVSWRVGTVYNLAPGTALFAQYNEATMPVAALLLANLANYDFELSTGRSVEAGIKSVLWNDRLVATASVYQIEQDNILTRDPLNPSLTVQGGSQRSRGVEIEVAVAVTEQWKISGNATWIDAEFTELRSAAGDFAGNRPPNVPDHAMYAMSTYRFDSAPLTVGASLQYVGPFYTDNANTIKVGERALLDAWLAYDVGGGTFRLRGRNLTNAFYADWSGYSSTQIYLGAPRSVELSYNVRF